MNGIILVDKPAGISSFGVVGRVRYALSQQAGKKVKVGHTGTLDPFATGLLILVVGTACKRAAEFSGLGKTYQCTATLGLTSSTGDPEGELQAVSDRQPLRPDVEAALEQFRGEITQVPPAYSAIKVNGQRAYKLARAGKQVVMPSRQVNVYSLDLISYNYPQLVFAAHVSSGTYIRTLAEDIGTTLGTGAYSRALCRTAVSKWQLTDAQSHENAVKNPKILAF